MSINSRFSVAIHILALLAIKPGPLSSKEIADSVNTNPVVIRRILGLLGKAGLVDTHLGVEGGSVLARPAEQITLLEVYRITQANSLFALHSKPPNPCCPAGRTIKPILTSVFNQAEAAMEQVFVQTTIADIAQSIIVNAESNP